MQKPTLDEIFDVQNPQDFQRTLFLIALNINGQYITEDEKDQICTALTVMYDSTERRRNLEEGEEKKSLVEAALSNN